MIIISSTCQNLVWAPLWFCGLSLFFPVKQEIPFWCSSGFCYRKYDCAFQVLHGNTNIISLLHWSLHIETWLGKTAACRNLGAPCVKTTCWWKFLMQKDQEDYYLDFCPTLVSLLQLSGLIKKMKQQFNSLPSQSPSADGCGPCLGMCGSRCGSWGKFAHRCQFFVAHAGHLITFLVL